MNRDILQKVKSTFEADLRVSSLFCDYAEDYFSEKVDNHKMLQNLYWETVLTSENRPSDYLILGNEKHDHDTYREINDKKGHVAKLVAPHPRDLHSELSGCRTVTHLISCGAVTHTPNSIAKNDLYALQEIWPETLYCGWKTSNEVLEHQNFFSDFMDQLLIAEISGAARIKRILYESRKHLKKLQSKEYEPKKIKKLKQLTNHPLGWCQGLLTVTPKSEQTKRHDLYHLRYAAETVDFHFAKTLTAWLIESTQWPTQKGEPSDVSAYISTPHPVVTGFLQRYLTTNTAINIKQIFLPDIIFGNNFSAGYLGFLKKRGSSVFIDLNSFPDIYVWHSQTGGGL
jgi:hypothetical protein